MKTVTAVLIGAGMRGAQVYAGYALEYPNELKIVAVADPDPNRKAEMAYLHKIPEEMQFCSYEEVLAKPRLADCAIIGTQDRMHFTPVIRALEKGYHVLCEKPMSPVKEEIIQMGEMAEKYGRILSICHVLRYSPFFTKIKEMLDNKVIGDLAAVQHVESVGYYHQAHSFVRGNWNNDEVTSPMILQKCCHDMDILSWLADSRCLRVSSFGSLKYFRKENAPVNAPDYCLDGCEHRDSCPFYAPRFYLEHPKAEIDGFVKAVSIDTSRKAVLEALKNGPYGRCVFKCDNNVVDHQVVNLEFENEVTVSFAMSAFTNSCERIINLMGTTGQIRGNMEQNEIEYLDFASGNRQLIQIHTSEKGHSGSDTCMMRDFVRLVASDGAAGAKTSAELSVDSHLIALAAETSRIEKRVIEFKEFKENR